jgi:hypothetical protein
MAKVFILVMLSTLILLTGCSSSNTSSETEPSQFIFQQSATPLELSIKPSVVMLGQTANITVKTSPRAFVLITIFSPDQPNVALGPMYNLLQSGSLASMTTADDKGMFITTFGKKISQNADGRLLAQTPGYYRLIVTAEAWNDPRNDPQYERYSKLFGENYENIDSFRFNFHSGNMTTVIASFLVR